MLNFALTPIIIALPRLMRLWPVLMTALCRVGLYSYGSGYERRRNALRHGGRRRAHFQHPDAAGSVSAACFSGSAFIGKAVKG
jgi:hypothetical protein